MGSIVPGPDGRLFVRAGAVSGGPTGRVLSFAPGGHTPVVEATGLNSAIGLAFAGPRLLMTDAGRNDLGPFRPPEEVDAFGPSGPVVDFGFPACYGQGGRACVGTRGPLTKLPAHAASAGIAVAGDVAYVAETARRSSRARAAATSCAWNSAPAATASSGAPRSSTIRSARRSARTAICT